MNNFDAIRNLLPEDPTAAAAFVASRLLESRRANKLQEYKPHEKQAVFHRMGVSKAIRCFFAGNRVGKTFCGASEVACHATGRYPPDWEGRRFNGPTRIWVASDTGETTRDIVQRELLGPPSDWGTGTLPSSTLGRRTMRRNIADAVDTQMVRHASGRWSEIGFKSYDQGRNKFQGTSKHVIWLDEEPPQDVFDECRMRIMDTRGNMLLTLTPLSGMTDVCKKFLDNISDPQLGFVVASWADNPYLSPQIIKELEDAMLPHEREARQHGRPVLGAGKIYPFTEASLKVEPFEIPAHYKRLAGMDFGWTHPTAVIWGAWDYFADIVYLYAEHYMAQEPPLTHATVIRSKGDWIPKVGDPSGEASSKKDGESLFEEYQKLGVTIHPADNSVISGIIRTYQRMKTGGLKVFSNLDYWWREFRLYHRNEKGAIVKVDDDLMDATRYLLSKLTMAITRPDPFMTAGYKYHSSLVL